jgi:hypothetical protein
MRRAVSAADRVGAVRSAAKRWKEAGLFGPERLEEILALHPDDRVRLGPAFRILFFLFAFVAGNAFAGLFFTIGGLRNDTEAIGTLALALGVVFGVATELQTTILRRREGGSEEATACLTIGYVVLGSALLLDRRFGFVDRDLVLVVLAVAALLCAAAAFHWGMPLLAVPAAVLLFGVLARVPEGRFAWVVGGVVGTAAAHRLSRDPRLPPAHRASASGALLVSLLALYAAFNTLSVDEGFVELIAELGGTRHLSSLPRWLSISGTALLPAIALALGIRKRSKELLLAGAATSTASLVTLRHYVHLAPLWVVLSGAGALVVVSVLLLRRWLDAGIGKERGGFTAEPLEADEKIRRFVETAAVLIRHTPDAQETSPKQAGFEGGGGRSGGAGGTGDF